jgi:hypothetical protein
MRILPCALVAVALLSGCFDLQDDGGDEGWDPDGDHLDRWALEELDGRTRQTLGQRDVFTPAAGTFGFDVNVPKGGARSVTWRLEVTGANVDSHVEGPGCQDGGLQVGGAGDSTITGSCGDLPAGHHDFAIVHVAGAVDLKAEVTGLVVAT